ncbi:MAG: hypothetical protein DMG65_24625 [Candidatus Angelobacter sp. Gp1-AA117]|nr:MAG: hypothetical protein DMG65_24625 [Candidatus Angelobacter sp. Gp1-AA117]
MDTLPGEKLLLESDNGKLLLTTHRVRFAAVTWGNSRFTSIMLEEVSSCEITLLSHPRLLALALLFFIVMVYARSAFYVQRFSIGVEDLILPGILVALYLATRRRVISLRSAGVAIHVPITRMSAGTAMEFIGAVEGAKNERYLLGKQAAGGFRPA